MSNRIALLLVGATFVYGQAQMRAVVTGSRVRVEAAAEAGKLRERFLAKDGSAWVELAFRNGQWVAALSADRKTLAEDLTIGSLRARRTLSLTAREHWLKVTTRLEGTSPPRCTLSRTRSTPPFRRSGRMRRRWAASSRTRSTKVPSSSCSRAAARWASCRMFCP
jgi:hypothetical protein